MKATCVTAEGPFPNYHPDFGECPEWYVCKADDDGCETGEVHIFTSRKEAVEFGAKLARKSRLEFVDDTFQA